MERSWGRRFAATVVLAASVWGCSAWAQGDKLTASAEKLMEENDFANAMPMLLQAANHGDARAKLDLGVVYEKRAELTGRDQERALGWYREAALAGLPDAMMKLGEMYENGEVDKKSDTVSAAAWYERAAKLGDAEGVLKEAAMDGRSDKAAGRARELALLEGLAAKRDAFGPGKVRLTEAQEGTLREQLVDISTNALLQGEVKTTLQAARLLAELGQPSQLLSLALIYANGEGSLPPEKILRSATESERLLKMVGDPAKLSVDDKNVYWAAQKSIADDFMLGTGAVKDAAKAVEIYQAIAASGDVSVALMLAERYARGDGVAFNVNEASLRLAAVGDASKLGPDDEEAYYGVQDSLAEDYARGRGVAPDKKKALELYESAADGGNQSASIAAGLMYVEGRVTPFDAEKAREYLTLQLDIKVPHPLVMFGWMSSKEAAKELKGTDRMRYARATRMLAERFERGDGAEESLGLAREWYLIAATAGDPIAEARLSKIPPTPPMKLEPPKIRVGATAGYIGGAGSVKAVAAPPAPKSVSLGNSGEASTEASVEECYPNIEAPEVVHPAEEFAVQVSLTGEQISPETKIVSGKQNEGKLEIPMPAGMTLIELEVNLTSPGMEFVDGSNMATIELDKGQDSTVAQFHLRVRAGTPAGTPKLMATFWYNHGFLARIERSVEITEVASAAGAVNSGAAQPMARTMAAHAVPAIAAPKPNETGSKQTGIQLDAEMAVPDLTILESRSGDALHLTFVSRYSSPVEDTLPKEAEMRAYLHAKFAAMAQQGRGTTVASTSSAQAGTDFAHGFGNELWDRFAPPGLKKLYWQLRDAGVQVRTIQVLSDDPVVPWELMRPVRENGRDRQDFLGLTTRVARWQMGASSMPRPPQTLDVKRMVVVAPRYAGAMALSGAQMEAAALHTAEGFEEVRGNYADFRALAANLPDGVVHFAGHGQVKQADGGAQFAILLEDGEVVPETWKELSSASTTHPFYFFNACEVGQAQQAVSALDGWGPALLESGASGYMGALWPVSDKAAGTFAGNFYKWMAANPGMPVAEVVRATRQQTFEQTHDVTSLAYVLYADPYLEVRR